MNQKRNEKKKGLVSQDRSLLKRITALASNKLAGYFQLLPSTGQLSYIIDSHIFFLILKV